MDMPVEQAPPKKKMFTWLDMALAKTEEQRAAIEKELEIQAVEAHMQIPIDHARMQAEDDARLRAELVANGYIQVM